MTHEIRETKLLELEQLEDTISYLKLRVKQCKSLAKTLISEDEIKELRGELEGFKHLLKPKKKQKKRLNKELCYTIAKEDRKIDHDKLAKILQELKIEGHDG